MNQKQEHTEPPKSLNSNEKHSNSDEKHNATFLEDVEQVEKFSESMKLRRKYTDVADAAQEAFESAAHAAAAARAAVELSMSKSMENKDQHDSENQGGTLSDIDISSKIKALTITNSAASDKIEQLVNRLGFEKIQLAEDQGRSKSEGEDDLAYESLHDTCPEEEAENEKKATERKSSASITDIEEKNRKNWLENLPVNENKHNGLSNASMDDKLSNKDGIIKRSSQ